MSRSLWWCLAALIVAGLAAPAQVIRFESGGLDYQTLSRSGLTTMFAHLPSQVREYTIVQAAVSNGSKMTCTVQPEGFAFRFPDGRELRAEGAEAVVSNLFERANRTDVMRLISTYEIGLYGLNRRSTSGYEQRRLAAQAALVSTKLSAAAAASAIVFVETKLNPGDSTDGALFFPARGRPLEGARLRVTVCGQLFEFDVEPAVSR